MAGVEVSAISHHNSEAQSLPAMVRAAAALLAGAQSAAEILVAREAAGLAYDAARRAARLSKATAAHDEIVAASHKAQADALAIEIEADCRLADEVDAAQARGDICEHGGRRKKAEVASKPSLPEIGLQSKQIHHARHVRNALKHRPDALRRAVDSLLIRGAQPTRSALRRDLGIVPKQPSEKVDDFLKLIDGRDIRRLSYFEIGPRKAQLLRELRFLTAVEKHVADPAPDLRVGAAIGNRALKAYFDEAGA